MIDALRDAYAAFYDLPAKSNEQFDLMGITAKLVRLTNPVVLPENDILRHIETFYEAFKTKNITPAQNKALDGLLYSVIA